MGILVPKPMLGRQLPTGRARGLVGLWLFNEGSGNKVFDLSGKGLTGTFSGDTTWTAGKFGSALIMDGTDDLVKLPAGKLWEAFTERTVCAWITIGSGISGPAVFFQTGGVSIGLSLGYRTTPDIIYFATKDGSNYVEIRSTTTFVEDDTWIHVVAVFDNGAMRLYINGVLESSDTQVDTIPASTGDAGLCGVNGTDISSAFSWKGRADNFSMYNRALSASEIAELYLRPFAMFDREPLPLWTAATQGIITVGQPTMRRWANIPHMSYLGRRSA